MARVGRPRVAGQRLTYTRPATEQEKVMANCMTMDNRANLEAKLFSLGGKQVFIQSNPYMGLLLKRGQVFRPGGNLKVPGPSYLANRPAVLRYLEHFFFDHPDVIALVTGYRLGEQEVWTTGSWLWDGKRVFDHTNTLLYFGVPLTHEEAYQFVSTTLATVVPGGQGQSEPNQPAPP